MIKKTKWYIHPILIFALSTITLGVSLFLYIYWYVTVSKSLKDIIARYQLDPNQFFEAQTWVVILVLSILVGIILTGILIIFNYNLKTIQLYRLQHSFINNFTHELKTPVTSLKIFLETFARHQIPREEQLKYIEYMLQDIERLSLNINSILNVARMESKVYDGELTPVHIVEFIRNFLHGNTHVFRDSEILVEDTNGREYVLELNVPLFEILLMNIFTNAIKYNDSERPRIDVEFGVPDKPGKMDKMLQIRFRDNGIGIARNERKKIFRKFYQGSHKEDRVIVRGSGIGLYMVQQIAKLHKGKIAADSEGAGKGSIFTLTLPIQQKLQEQS